MMGVILRVELGRYHERTFGTPFYLLPSAPLLAALHTASQKCANFGLLQLRRTQTDFWWFPV